MKTPTKYKNLWPTKPAKTDAVFEYLKECARDMRTVTYEDLASKVGLAKPGVGRPLGYIRDRLCRDQELPWLNAIAVKKHSRRPGDAFLPRGLKIADVEERLWRG